MNTRPAPTFMCRPAILPASMRPVALLALACALVPPGAQAQSYPNKPIRMVVPFAPGGGADFIARPVAAKLTDALGQYVVIDNRGGANGSIGAEAVARATADGYTLLFGSAGVITTGPLLDSKLKYDVERDFVPVALLAEVPFFLITHASVKAKTMKELVAYARANPGKLKYGSSGVGGAPHLAGELLDNIAKISTLHIAYRGLGPVLNDLLAGRIDYTFVGISVVQQHVATGRLAALGTTGERRSPIAPELPTMAEAGLPGFKAGTWYGVLAPAGTPRTIVQRLNADMNRILAQPDIKERLAATGAEPSGNTPEQFAAYMRSERQRWDAVIKSAMIKLEP